MECGNGRLSAEHTDFVQKFLSHNDEAQLRKAIVPIVQDPHVSFSDKFLCVFHLKDYVSRWKKRKSDTTLFAFIVNFLIEDFTSENTYKFDASSVLETAIRFVDVFRWDIEEKNLFDFYNAFRRHLRFACNSYLIIPVLNLFKAYNKTNYITAYVGETVLELLCDYVSFSERGPADSFLYNYVSFKSGAFLLYHPKFLLWLKKILQHFIPGFLWLLIKEFKSAFLVVCSSFSDQKTVEFILRKINKSFDNSFLFDLWPSYMTQVLGPDYIENYHSSKNNGKYYNGQCPITLCNYVDPVMASDGFVYEREAILKWLTSNVTSPLTREGLSYQVIPISNTMFEESDKNECEYGQEKMKTI